MPGSAGHPLSNNGPYMGHAPTKMSPIQVSSGGMISHGICPSTTKGLRQFSLRVCRKVEEKGITSYNEVADELVADLGGEGEQKNIRRRVYDALNVLMAMDIIRKDKKEIVWLGLPNDVLQELHQVEREKQTIQHRLDQKKKNLQDLIAKHAMTKNLIERNRQRESENAGGQTQSMINPESGSASAPPQDLLHLPFILINAPRDCKINCEMLEDRSHYYFEFDAPFLIHEDAEVLRFMGLSERMAGTLEHPVQYETDCLSYMDPLMVSSFHPNTNETHTGSATYLNPSTFPPASSIHYPS